MVGRCQPDDIPKVEKIPVDRVDLAEYFAAELAPKFANRA